MTARKVGGIWFLRVGQLSLSFCVTRRYASFWHSTEAQLLVTGWILGAGYAVAYLYGA